MSHKRNPILTVCVVLFGISAWIEINGVLVQLPIFVGQLPESDYIASYIIAATQLANIAPIAYGIMRRALPGKMKEKALIHGTFVIGVISCILLSAFWKTTSYIGNTLHSTVLLVLVFFLAIIDCTSSVLYLPFMANLRSVYLIPYLIGEGLSGLVPSCIALIQGVGGNPECVTVPVNVTDAHCMSFDENDSVVECLNWTTSFSCLPYGIIAFHLAATLSVMANPLACFVALYFWTDNQRVLFVEIGVGTFLAIYIMVTAVQSPLPPLVGTGAGAATVVVSWVAFYGILSYVKACFAAMLRQHGGGKSLFHYGAITQIGSFIGAVVMFGVINFTNSFSSYSLCT